MNLLTVFDEVTEKKGSYRSTLRWIKKEGKREERERKKKEMERMLERRK